MGGRWVLSIGTNNAARQDGLCSERESERDSEIMLMIMFWPLLQIPVML